MKRSISEAECCDSEELNSRHQITVNQVLGSHDLVPTLIAPLLDLRSLYYLSRVNRRLRELLYWTPTLEKARHYKGTITGDFPETLLAYPDIRITRYLASVVFADGGGGNDKVSLPWLETCRPTQPGHRIEYLNRNVLVPLLTCASLSNDELAQHVTLIHNYMFRDFSANRYGIAGDSFRLNLCTVLSHVILTQLAKRVANIDIFRWHWRVYAPLLLLSENHMRVFLHKYVLIAQTGANVIVRDGIISDIGQMYAHQAGPLLFAAVASDRVDFFNAEFVRLGQPVSTGTLITVAALCKGPEGNVFSRLIKTASQADINCEKREP